MMIRTILGWTLRGGVPAAVLAVLLLGLGGGREAAQAQPPPAPIVYDCAEVVDSNSVEGGQVSIETQFNSLLAAELTINGQLCAPALKNGIGAPDMPLLGCFYEGFATPDEETYVDLETQFGLFENVLVENLTFLCVPATKGPSPPPLNPAPYYACYDVTENIDPIAVTIESQLRTPPSYDTVADDLDKLCVSAVKDGADGNLGFPPLACFLTSGADDIAALLVQTQFGESNVSGIPSFGGRLCVETVKSIIGVGGIAELPDVAGTALGTEGSSGLSAGGIAGITAGIAALAVALSGGAWYVRRRVTR